MNQKTIEKLLKLPTSNEDGEPFNWQLYDKDGNLTIDYKSIFNEDDFETLVNILKDTDIWAEETDIYNASVAKTGLEELHHAHCWRTLALYQKEEVIDLLFEVFRVTNNYYISDIHFEDATNVLLLFRDNEKVMKRVCDDFSAQMTNKNQSIQKAISEFFKKFYDVTNAQNQEVIEKLWIDKLKEEVFKDENDLTELGEIFSDKYDLNGIILSGLLSTKLAEKHYELIKELMAENKADTTFCGDLEDIEVKIGMKTERITPRTSLFSSFSSFPDFGDGESPSISQSSGRVVSKSDQKKKKNKKKAVKASKKKNRK